MSEAASLVHNIETSVRFGLCDTYQAQRASADLKGWYASGEFYYAVDAAKESNYVDKWQHCRENSWFARQIETGEVRVFSSTCRLRWCSLCAGARRSYISHQVAEWIKVAPWPKFLTLTLKHSDEPLLYQVNELYEFFRKFRHTKLLKESVLGGIWFFQIKRSKNSGQWHPHLHCCVSGKYMARGELSRLWNKITSGSMVIDIRPIREPKQAAAEVARYASTPADITKLPREDYVELFEAVHCRKVCGTWGAAKCVSLKQGNADDKDKWFSIGTWHTVSYFQGKNDYADDIINAWRTGTPLAKGISMKLDDIEGMNRAVDSIIEKSTPYLTGFYDT